MEHSLGNDPSVHYSPAAKLLRGLADLQEKDEDLRGKLRDVWVKGVRPALVPDNESESKI